MDLIFGLNQLDVRGQSDFNGFRDLRLMGTSMDKLMKFFIFSVLALIASQSFASVVVDDFSQPATASNPSIDRDLFNATASPMTNTILVNNPGGVRYTSTSGVFGSGFETGVEFSSVAPSTGSNFVVSLFVDGNSTAVNTQSVGSGGPLSFATDLSGATSFAFSASNTFAVFGPPGSVIFSGALSAIEPVAAVPEPTSMLLVGMPVGCMLMRRRRL